ncbi:MAG: response regulator [Anaerolineae bacterium]|nr:MAG: response regulator [Anaerolineae bacterium]
MRIMYVEDNAVNLELVRRIARLGGHDVVSFSNGKDALDALQTDTAHLILMDIQLEGEMDGIEVVKRMRARGDQRPVIAITAYAMRGDEERILGAGCNDYLPKPLPISQFITLLAKYDPSNLQPQAKPEPAVAAAQKPVTSQLTLPKTHPAVAASTATPAASAVPVAPAVPTVTPTPPTPTPAAPVAPVTPPATPTAPTASSPVAASTTTSPTPMAAPVTSSVPATQAPAAPPTGGTPAAPNGDPTASSATEPVVETVVQVAPVPPNTQPVASAPKMEHSDDKPG